VIAAALAWWRAKRPPGGFPARTDIDPVALGRLLPHLALVDVAREPPPFRLRFRLCGAVLAAILGEDATGRACETVYPPAAMGAIRSEVERAMATGEPALVERRVLRPAGAVTRYRRIMLPLAADGRTVDALLLAFALLEAPAAR
jgi:hypothetical protein